MKTPITLEVIQRETFLAFFTFAQPEGVGAQLTGLVKIALPAAEDAGGTVNYVSLTFIVDTPSETVFRAAQALFAKVSAAPFQRYIPGVRALTSVPATAFVGPHYLHQLDIVFKGALPEDTRTLVAQIAVGVRQALSVVTEPPQRWEDDAPQKTAAEKANFGARLKALLSALAS